MKQSFIGISEKINGTFQSGTKLHDFVTKKLGKVKAIAHKFFFSFPVQLLLNNFKKNQILLLLWLFLFAVVTQQSGSVLGIPYLFLDPEYRNTVDYKGFLIIGIALGIFIVAFHITTYILDSFRFSFLGTISRPFSKFCFNNSIIPFAFLITYIVSIINFQLNNGFQLKSEIFLEILSLLFGIFFIILVVMLYFRWTNKDIFKELAKNVDKQLKKNTISRVNVLKKINNAKRSKYKIEYYFDLNCRFIKVPEFISYDKRTLIKIFDQNHLNAVIFEIFVIILIILLGLFRENSYFLIPAAASSILFFSIFIMFTGAVSYWLRGWALSSMIIILLSLNLIIKYERVNSIYQAYGLNYNTVHAEYSNKRLSELSSDSNFVKDYHSTISILENWKKKFPGKKKKMIFICTSGGGQRAAVWTTKTLQHVDSTLKGNLFRQSILITGASGGIIGASYFRELYLQKINGKKINIYEDQYTEKISKDILNPIIFSLAVNDLFFRFQKFNDGKYEYLKDRGYAFEQQLNINTDFVLDKRIADYTIPEQKAQIPLLILAPTVINDGRKMYISSQPISYMNTVSTQNQKELHQKIKGIEFTRFYKNQDAGNLHFLSALRMSATFPYITPNVELPSNPTMEIMDAGLTDNFGISDAVNFLFVFRDWISTNTSGVIFVVIRDSPKENPIEKKAETTFFQKLFTPIGSFYNTWDYLQDYNNDSFIEFAQSWFKAPLNVINFEYIPKPKSWDKLKEKKIDPLEVEKKEKEERAALSWHLTTREKESLKRTVNENNNKASLKKLQNLLNH